MGGGMEYSTGGATDLVLVDARGEGLDMGPLLDEKGPRMRTEPRGQPEEAKRNRYTLANRDELISNYFPPQTLTWGGANGSCRLTVTNWGIV
jgi:hypothetical protein